MSSDFAGTEYEFAAGSLFGLRGWGMDEKGRLHGVTHREVWRPGENVSVCKSTNYKRSRCPGPTRARVNIPKIQKRKWFGSIPDDLTYSLEPASMYSVEETWEPCRHPRCDGYDHFDDDAPDGHHFKPSCGCGFWAYDEASFAPQGEVVGVIEAFGKTTIGTKGFRAEKARIVGLCKNNSSGKALSRSVVARLSALYPDVLFCDDMDQLVTVFDGVMKTWAEVDEEFWTKPVPAKADEGWTRYFTTTPMSISYPRYFGGGVA